MDAKLRIKEIMVAKNMTEYKLAKLSGLSQSTISNIFNRNTSPTIPTIEAICKGLGISMAQFFSEDDENSVYLSNEQQILFDKWLLLSSEQKDIIEKIITTFTSQ